MNIKHIVLSGGAQIGFSIYSALARLIQNKFVDMSKIETMYATSAGTFVSVIASLPISNEDIDEYMINRPWENVFPLHPTDILNIYSSKGLYDDSFIRELFKPLFACCDLNMNITMKEFYEFSNIEHHFFSVDLNKMELINISYKTHPELPLLKAVHMSSAIPYIIQPVFYEDKCCIDGGAMSNFPINFCLEDTKCDKNEVLGIKSTSIYNNPKVDVNSNLFDVTYTLLYHSINAIRVKPFEDINYLINIPSNGIELSALRETIISKEARVKLFKDGITICDEFILEHLS
uniref:PNPLA domain-containing protein n=1 Tax=viral metagenome TaxID=1070528 RepID=A0A6C0EHB5_9ZZZZ